MLVAVNWDAVPPEMVSTLEVDSVRAAPEVTPEAGTDVAAIVPVPEAAKLAPVPTTIAAEVFVPLVKPLKAAEVEPVFVMVTVEPLFAKLMPVPAAIFREPCVAFAVPFVENREGRREALSVPEEMFEALVVSVVAEVAKPDTCAAGRLPVTPLAGTLVAAIKPEPLVVR
jgi:hypothetical protein